MPNMRVAIHLTRRLALLQKQPCRRMAATAPYSTGAAAGQNDGEWATRLREEMLSRPPTYVEDRLSPTRSLLLNRALADFLPDEAQPDRDGMVAMPPGHHLVYFPHMLTDSQLMADGTDPNHFPGPGFSRRMWAGGSVGFPPDALGRMHGLRMQGPRRYAACRESIADVAVRGAPGAEKIFVGLRREYGHFDKRDLHLPVAERPLTVRVDERRTIVFLRDREPDAPPPAAAADGTGSRGRVVQAPHAPDYSFELVPSQRLLFHFSALTHNAHLIHLDREFCRNHEGHRDLLVHGPLSLVLMLTALRAAASELLPPPPTAAAASPRGLSWVKSIDYRNLAPLYVDERMRLCVRRAPAAADSAATGGGGGGGSGAGGGLTEAWDVWIEGPDGGMAVKASAVTYGPWGVRPSTGENPDEYDDGKWMAAAKAGDVKPAIN